MEIRNIANPKIVRTVTKENWDKMPKKHQNLFEVLDTTDVPDQMEIQVTNNTNTQPTNNK